MKATTLWGTVLLMSVAACRQVRQTPAPPFDIADVLRTPSAVAPRQKTEPRWVWIDSAESRTLWLDTAGIERAGTDTFTVLTAFRFATPRPSRSGGRTYVEARLRHQVECTDRRMHTLEFDTRDAAGAVVESGRVDGTWLRPMEGSGYANLIDLVCDFEGYPAARRPEPEEQDSMAKGHGLSSVHL